MSTIDRRGITVGDITLTAGSFEFFGRIADGAHEGVWILANANWTGAQFVRIDETKPAFGLNLRALTDVPNQDSEGAALWRAAPGANPISDTYGIDGGWEPTEPVLDGLGLELDGDGVTPAGRLVHTLDGADLYTGICTNISTDFNADVGDTAAYPSWFFGRKNDDFIIGRIAAAGGFNPANLTILLKVASDGAATLKAVDAQQSVKFSGVVTPAQITANQNDYNPTGWSTAAVLRLTTDAARTLKGLAGGAAGRIAVIINAGSTNALLINSNDTDSVAANRFLLPKDFHFTLQPNTVAVFQYDATSLRWRPLANTVLQNTLGVDEFNQLYPLVDAINDLGTSVFRFKDFYISGIMQAGGFARVATQFDKTNDTLANVTGLSIAGLAAGASYQFEANLYTTSNVAGGVKASIAGGATATAIVADALTHDAVAVKAQSRVTALGSAVGAVTAVTAATIKITGVITVNAGGTLTVQFAQNATNASASSVLVGSNFKVWRVA